MDGLVYGYNYDYSKKILKKERQIKVEGALDNVIISVLDKGKVIRTAKTNSNGLFYIKIRTGKSYDVEFSKAGYSSVLLTVDLTAVPKEMAAKGISFSGAELLLNSFQSKTKTVNPSFGRLFYNTKENWLDFEENTNVTKKQKEYINNSASLMKRSVEKNKNVNDKEVIQPADGGKPEKISSKINTLPEVVTLKSSGRNKGFDTINRILSAFKLKIGEPGQMSSGDIESLENNIKEARAQFEIDRLNATTAEDSLVLKEKEYLLNAVELELTTAKKIIELQKNKISDQNKLLLLAVAFVILLSVFLLIIYRFNKEKKKTYLLLKEKNKKITDSINYASRIQESILPSDEEIKKQLPQSFIYFQPKDVVSGDFYWVYTVKEKTIVACVDCTGHGVPGAFMSLIGNTLLNEIVHEKQITDPSLILKHLHRGILKSLQQNSNSQSKDGMDMSLCVIDRSNNIIAYAGAMNPIYVVTDNTVSVVKPDVKSIGGEDTNDAAEFRNQTIPIRKSTSVYMFTDGYMDQFGGAENKKFNIPNFKKMLLDIQTESMAEQKKIVEKTIKSWQGDGRQIDDMLVIGIRF